MNPTTTALNLLFDRIPRRHSPDNVKDIYQLLAEYEDLLKKIEAENGWYEKNTNIFFDEIDAIKLVIKRSVDNKASKKNKDLFFDEASGSFKDNVQALLEVYADGSRAQ
ncbi:MAG: hypothetical protein ABI741_13305 [Ferruginibacter sp.]